MQPDIFLRYYLRQIPLVRLYLFFLGGLILHNNLTNNYILIPILVLIIVLLLLSQKLSDTSYFLRNSLKGFSFSLIFVVFGFLFPVGNQNYAETIPERTKWKAIALADAKVKENTTALIAEACPTNTEFKHQFKIRLTLENKETVPLPGDSIYFTSTLKRITNHKNPAEFDYATYMKRKGILYQTYLNKNDYEIFQVDKVSNIKFIALRWRSNLLNHLQVFDFNQENEAVLAALTLGYKNLLPEDVTERFANSGAMHILAVSGLHVGIIYMLFSFLLSLLPLKNKNFIFITIIIVIWLYALLTGLSTSVIRASLMFSFISMGKLLHRDVNIYNTIAAAAFLLTVNNPDIIFDVGFQLSFSAVTGIVFFQNYFQKLFTIKNPIIDYLYQLFTVSLAAQLVTLPFTLYYFHQFPVYFWLTNLIVIPMVFIIVLVFIFFLISSPIQTLNILIFNILNFLLTVLNWSIEKINKLPSSHISNIDADLFIVVVLALIVLTLGSIFFYFSFKKTVFLVVLFISPLVYDSYRQVKSTQNKSIVVFNARGSTLMCFQANQNATLLANQQLMDNNAQISYSIKNYLTKNRIKDSTLINIDKPKNTNKSISFCNSNFYILENNTVDSTFLEKKVNLLVRKNFLPTKNLHHKLTIERIILSNELNYYHKNIWKLYANTFQIPIVDIYETGAYILNF